MWRVLHKKALFFRQYNSADVSEAEVIDGISFTAKTAATAPLSD